MAKKFYRMCLEVKTPIFIGSGEKLTKKDYIYVPSRDRWIGEDRIIVPDRLKLFEVFQRAKFLNSYEDFLKDEKKNDLYKLLSSNSKTWSKVSIPYLTKYAFSLEDVLERYFNIQTFIKDSFQKPYVPGSSIKGMLRTALLSEEIMNKPGKYSEMQQSIKKKDKGQGGRQYLKSETQSIEALAFHTLQKNEDKRNAVNSSLQGLIVSDSEPLEPSDLILGQKIDVTLSGKENKLSVFREMLKPGVKVRFSITLDENICGFSMEEIFEALNHFHQWNNDYFYSRFHRRNMGEDIVYLGGGVGFSSKTVVDALFPEEDEGLQVKDRIFRETLGKKYSEHHHEEDKKLKIAPHVCKCTRYQGKLYNVGIGQLHILNDERIV